MGEINQRKKDLIMQYKERKTTGGVYSITNNKTGQKHLFADIDLNGSKNRFEFAKFAGSCVIYKLQNEWKEYGSDAFSFEILEEIEKNEVQTIKQFKEDLALLLEMWNDKLNIGN